MSKERNGYVYQEIVWFAVVSYKDKSGQRQTIKRRAISEAHASEVAEQVIQDLKEKASASLKPSYKIISEKGAWYARATYTDDGGKRRNVKRRGDNKTHAKELLKDVLRELDDHGSRGLESAQMTFADLADHYEKNYLIEPQYIDGRKVAGLRSRASLLPRLRVIKEYFGKSKLRSIKHGDIERFRSSRLKTSTKRGPQRSIASVNRELSLLRRTLNVAMRQGWILRNPFDMGDTLITLSDEKQRERILNREEEERLLAVCIGRRSHLRAVIICAIDTGMRKGEILKLKWSDIDFENRIINVRAFNTKTMRERQVAMSLRLAAELEALYNQSTKDFDSLVFGITDDVKRSFNSARKDAHLPDVRFHDLRHTHATRLVSAHIPLSEVGRVLGHTQANTTYRYVNANVETARRAAAVIDEFNSEREALAQPDMVN
jgi:integrase